MNIVTRLISASLVRQLFWKYSWPLLEVLLGSRILMVLASELVASWLR